MPIYTTPPTLTPRVLISGSIYGSTYDGFDITNEVKGWGHTHRAQGGYWSAGFQMRGELREMLQIFNNWLGFGIKEVTGGLQTWDGIVYEIDLTYHGVIRRRSLDMLVNHLTIFYEDNDGKAKNTDAGLVEDSIAHFGRREGVETADYLSDTAATALRDTLLKRWGWPYMLPVGAEIKQYVKPVLGEDIEKNYSGADQAVLDITCMGRIHTANWRFQQVGDESEDSISDWIIEILDTDCEFLEPGIINSNTIPVYKATSQPRRCYDVMQDLVKIGDTSGNPYRLYCGNNGLTYYEMIDVTPVYYMRDGVLMTVAGDVPANPWTVRPAVVRDADMPITGISLYGGWLPDARNFYPDEISVDESGNITMKTAMFDEGALLIAQLAALADIFVPEED